MLDTSVALSYYSRDDIAQAMVKASEGREVAVRYGDKGFGKRPDMLKYPAEIKEFAKQGVTSFHVSEERWKDPLAISAQLKQQELADLRAGWDLVIDIDSKDWQISRIASHLVVQALQAHGITCLSAKFSGNKGFHIAVPFESFPPTVLGVETRLQFPAFPRRVAQYLVDYIKDKYITIGTDKITFANSYSLSIEDLTRITEKPIYLECQSCLKEVGKKTEQTKTDFACPRCEHIATTTEEIDYLSCEKCGAIMEKMPRKESKLCCQSCGSTDVQPRFNVLSVIEIDTLLISSRHMYRLVYSLHEKSGLASIPVAPEEILDFDKQRALPLHVVVDKEFLSSAREDDAKALFGKVQEDERRVRELQREDTEKLLPKDEVNYQALTEAAPEQFFPPCLKAILPGLKDGKKRAMFVLVNFLLNVGWPPEEVDKKVREWNERNPEPLRENDIVAHLRHHKQRKLLPPNCANSMYYKDLGVCHPDGVCKWIKNPVMYTRKKVFSHKAFEEEQKPKNKSVSGPETEGQIPKTDKDSEKQ